LQRGDGGAHFSSITAVFLRSWSWNSAIIFSMSSYSGHVGDLVCFDFTPFLTHIRSNHRVSKTNMCPVNLIQPKSKYFCACLVWEVGEIWQLFNGQMFITTWANDARGLISMTHRKEVQCYTNKILPLFCNSFLT